MSRLLPLEIYPQEESGWGQICSEIRWKLSCALTKESISIQCNDFEHNNVARDVTYPFLHISSKKILCSKSWCKSDVDPARIRCCHQHRLSNKTYSAIPEQRTTRQLCFHWRTSQPLKQTGRSHSNEPDQEKSANRYFLSFSELGQHWKNCFLGVIPKLLDPPHPWALLGIWILAKFRNTNVNFMAKTMATKISHKV